MKMDSEGEQCSQGKSLQAFSALCVEYWTSTEANIRHRKHLRNSGKNWSVTAETKSNIILKRLDKKIAKQPYRGFLRPTVTWMQNIIYLIINCVLFIYDTQLHSCYVHNTHNCFKNVFKSNHIRSCGKEVC